LYQLTFSRDREEFFRLKKVKGNKKKEQERIDAELKAKAEEEGKTTLTGVDDDAPDVLGDEEDKDVIF